MSLSRSLSIAMILVPAALVAEAQGAVELLQGVDQGQAQRLAEYNSVFLQEQTYFASRSRIVQVNVDALLQESDVTFTPFADVAPMKLICTRLDRQWNEFAYWHGSYENDPLFRATGGAMGSLSVTVAMVAWDVDESGTAVRSAPDTHSFFSAFAVFDVHAGAKYVVQPLKYTPRYSAVYEIPRDTVIPIRIDREPGEPEFRDDAERESWERYRAFRDALPEEKDKQVLGDIP